MERNYFCLLKTDGNLPRAYGLPKMHKENHPLRIIVSCIDSPSYFLSKYICNIIYDSIGKLGSYIKDSIDLKNFITSEKVKAQCILGKSCMMFIVKNH